MSCRGEKRIVEPVWQVRRDTATSPRGVVHSAFAKSAPTRPRTSLTNNTTYKAGHLLIRPPLTASLVSCAAGILDRYRSVASSAARAPPLLPLSGGSFFALPASRRSRWRRTHSRASKSATSLSYVTLREHKERSAAAVEQRTEQGRVRSPWARPLPFNCSCCNADGNHEGNTETGSRNQQRTLTLP